MNNWHIFYLLAGITIGTTVLSGLVNAPNFFDWEWLSAWLQNFSTEMMGAILTFLIFDLIVNTRNEKKDLILDLKSGDKTEYVKALDQLKANHWLVDGSLEKANLANAKLPHQELAYINLKGAYLRNVDFEGAKLVYAELENAVLIDANLRDADLSSCDLENADLKNADLRGASLGGANLKGANLTNAKFDHTTKWIKPVGQEQIPAILPDGENWTNTSNLEKFTKPDA
jgi:uncharacterized protein YjbI with pentapeptide repeats